MERKNTCFSEKISIVTVKLPLLFLTERPVMVEIFLQRCQFSIVEGLGILIQRQEEQPNYQNLNYFFFCLIP